MTRNEHFSVWREAYKNTFTLNSTLAAAGLAYFSFFSFFPFILLVVALASRWFDPLWVENELISQLDFVIPGISRLFGDNLVQVIQARRSITTSASLILIWSGSTLFSFVARILDTIWNGHDVRSNIRYRGLALLFVGGFSLVVLPLLFIGTWAAPLVKELLPDFSHLFFLNIGFFASVLLSSVLFGLLYYYLPHSGPVWKDIWIGAVAAGLLWEVAKRLFVGYTACFLSASNLVYGSVSTIIAFLMWVYFSGLIFFFGAYLGVGYSRKAKELASEEKVENDETEGSAEG